MQQFYLILQLRDLPACNLPSAGTCKSPHLQRTLCYTKLDTLEPATRYKKKINPCLTWKRLAHTFDLDQRLGQKNVFWVFLPPTLKVVFLANFRIWRKLELGVPQNTCVTPAMALSENWQRGKTPKLLMPELWILYMTLDRLKLYPHMKFRRISWPWVIAK